MSMAELQARLRESEERIAELRRELTLRSATEDALRADCEALRIQVETLRAERDWQSGELRAMSGDVAAERITTLTKDLAAARHDYAALLDASQVLTRRCEGLETRVAELEATNKRLVDMVWGRRSERRKDSPGQLPLGFSAELLAPPSPEQQEVIAAQALADEAFDRELLERLAARRKARR